MRSTFLQANEEIHINSIEFRSAVNLGYFKDPFVQFFAKRPIRRSPIINRGIHRYIRYGGKKEV